MIQKTIDINENTIRLFVESIRPKDPEIRKQIDMGFSYDVTLVLLYEIRPDWKDKTIINQHEFAKIKHIKSRNIWQLYWMRASEKWELYKPFPESSHLQKILEVIKEDKQGCFFG